jgi:hypothetical protein
VKGFLFALKVVSSLGMALVMTEKAIAIAKKAVQYVIGLFSTKKQPVSKFQPYGA